jgi:hypothetical protein
LLVQGRLAQAVLQRTVPLTLPVMSGGLGALSQAWVTAEASLPLGWHLIGVWRDQEAPGEWMAVVALLLAVEDVLRLFPDDPEDPPAAVRLAELTAQLLPELRILLEDPGERVLN